MRDDHDLDDDDDDDDEEFEDPSWTPRQAVNELARLFDCESEDGTEIEFPPEPGFTVDEYISLGSREHLGEWNSLLIPMGFLTNVLWVLAKYGYGFYEDEVLSPVIYQFQSIQWDKAPVEWYRNDELSVHATSAVFTRGRLVAELSKLELGDTQLFETMSTDFGVVEFAENFGVPQWVAYRAQQASRSIEESRILWEQIRQHRKRQAQMRNRDRTEELEAKTAMEWLHSSRQLGEEWSTAEARERARDEEIERKLTERRLREWYSQESSKLGDEDL